jgi:hypothetical protein
VRESIGIAGCIFHEQSQWDRGNPQRPARIDPEQYVLTSYVAWQNLSLRMGQHRFTRLTNGFSKKLDNHVAAVALYVAHYNLCRFHEALKVTPTKAPGVVDRRWSIGDLIDAALATQPVNLVVTAPERRKRFAVIDGGKS